MNKKVKRGQIYRVNLDPVVGSEQGGIRPMLIVQTDGFNKSSTTVIAMAITSKFNKRRDLATHVVVRCNELPHDSLSYLRSRSEPWINLAWSSTSAERATIR